MIKMIKRQVVIKMRNNVENIILTHQRPMGLMSPFRNKLNFLQYMIPSVIFICSTFFLVSSRHITIYTGPYIITFVVLSG